MGALDGKWPSLFAGAAACTLASGTYAGQFPLTAVGLIGFAIFNCILWVFFTGGIMNMIEALEAAWMPKMPWPPPKADQRLKGSNVVITGASRGLGLAVTRYIHGFAASEVVLADILNCTAAVDSLNADRSDSASTLRLDLNNPASVVDFAKSIESKGKKIDFLVLNAGIADKDPVPGPAGSSIRRMFWVNYLGNVILVSELLKRGMISKGARILVVCSGSHEYGNTQKFAWQDWNPLQSAMAYAQSKFLVQMWSHRLAAQLRPRGIEVVSACPGPVNSGLGCEHVPLPLWPSFMLMRELIYNPPETPARAIVNLLVRQQDFPSGTYLCVRKTKKLIPSITDPASQQWLIDHTQSALAEVNYKGWNPKEE